MVGAAATGAEATGVVGAAAKGAAGTGAASMGAAAKGAADMGTACQPCGCCGHSPPRTPLGAAIGCEGVGRDAFGADARLEPTSCSSSTTRLSSSLTR